MYTQGRHVDVALGTVQQHIGPQGKLPGELRPGAHGRTSLRIRRQRIQEHLSDETVHLRVSSKSFINFNTNKHDIKILNDNVVFCDDSIELIEKDILHKFKKNSVHIGQNHPSKY